MGQRRWKSAWPLAVVGVVSMLGVPGIAGASAAGNANPAAAAGSANGVTPVCPGPAAAGSALCRALLLDNPASWRGQHVTGSKGPSPSSATPSGYGPADLQAAYSLPSTSSGSGKTVAIVDAYNDPNAATDLATYRIKFGLKPCSNGTCFHQVNQSGGTSLPRANTGWAEEISLDLDMVSAVCPNCNILLVEASSNSFANLATAENYAKNQSGVVAISNSYGGNEFSGEASYDSYYSSDSAAITVSSGDGGYGTEYPAASPYVTAVGGTSLSKATGTTRGWTETAWSGAGSGCSAYETRPTSQYSVRTTSPATARSEWWPTCRPMPIPKPAWPCTTATASRGGWSSGALAWPPRSWLRSTPWPTPPWARRQSAALPYSNSIVAQRRHSPGATGAVAARHCARQGAAGMDLPASVPRTGSAAF